MDYEKIYNDFIQNSATKNRVKLNKNDKNYTYYENHHVLPRCIGGDDSKENLILLTPREHFLAHKLLSEMFPKIEKLRYTVYKMAENWTKSKYKNFRISNFELNRLNLSPEYKKKDEFIMIYLNNMDELLKIRGIEMQILFCLFKMTEWGNQAIIIDKKVKEDIAKEIDVKVQSISDALSRLSKNKFLLKNCRMRYSLNPKYFYKGGISERNKSINQ